MTVDSTTSTTPTATSPTDGTASRSSNKTLGQEDFLKLLTVQLAQQDPMKPMDDTQFMAQMAQFTSLQQTKEMSDTMTAMKASTNLASASSLIGRRVTVSTKTGDVTGDVAGVDASSGTPELEIAGNLYDLSTIKTIEQQPTATATP